MQIWQPKRVGRPQTPILLQLLLALSWGAYLGYQHTKLIPFLAVALAFAAVIIWFDRKHVDTRGRPALAFTEAYIGIALWSAGVMALAYWPVRLIHQISDKHSASHVIAAINYHNGAAAIANKSCGTGVMCVLSQADWNAVYSDDEKALSEARQADISDMNRHYPGFGDHFKNEFIEGLTLIVENGNDSAKRPEFMKGQILVHRFGDWFEANEDAIRSGK